MAYYHSRRRSWSRPPRRKKLARLWHEDLGMFSIPDPPFEKKRKKQELIFGSAIAAAMMTPSLSVGIIPLMLGRR